MLSNIPSKTRYSGRPVRYSDSGACVGFSTTFGRLAWDVLEDVRSTGEPEDAAVAG